MLEHHRILYFKKHTAKEMMEDVFFDMLLNYRGCSYVILEEKTQVKRQML